MNGRAAGIAWGRPIYTARKAAPASATPPAILRKIPKRFRFTEYLAWAAVIHSSKFLRVMNRRTSVRKIASDMSHAWYARNVMVSPMCDRASEKSDSTPRMWLRLEIPPCRGAIPNRQGISGGIAIISRTNRVNIQGDSGYISHPTINVRNMAGAESVRRRVSIIFHRLIGGMVYRCCFSCDTPPLPKIHGRSCQSPRAQRCCRAVAAS